jgi:hypothetical protein
MGPLGGIRIVDLTTMLVSLGLPLSISASIDCRMAYRWVR